MKDKDYIKDLFSEKLSKHEVPVRSDLWSGIQSQIGNSAAPTVVAKGISSSLKWMIGMASSLAVIGTAVWISSLPEDKKEEQKVSLVQNKGIENIKEEIETGVKSGAKITNVREENSAQAVFSVPQAELPSSNYLDEWISREKQSKGLDNSFIGVSQPKDEIIPNPMIAESVSSTSASTIAVSAPKPVEVKTFEDGKIEEFVNVFTPNGDGMNDVFFLNSENLKDFTIRIFNDKDQLVFQSSDKDFKWLGVNAVGNMVEPGNYGYIIFATDLNGKNIKMFKSLTIK